MNNEEGFINLADTSSENKDFKTIIMPQNVAPEVKKYDIENNIKSISSSDVNQEKRLFNTINEPIIETLKRDLMIIAYKIRHVLNPYMTDTDRSKQLRSWDLWGPLVLCIVLSLSLGIGNSDKSNLFVLVFIIFWLGGVVITLNSKLLGANISIFQILCLLGYCMFPINLITFIFKCIIEINEFVKFIVVMFACAWSSYSSIGFLKNLISNEKKLLVLYPVILFYLFLSWFVLMNHK